MTFEFLNFLTKPWFVVPWYTIGLLGAVWVLRDTLSVNTNVNTALKGAWPIIVFFFSVIGLALYWWTCRPPGIADVEGEDAASAHHEYVSKPRRKVTGAVVHCVGGDGLGIITAMAAMRLLDTSFWVEFWVEYAVGFAFGWFLFQSVSFKKMEDIGWVEAVLKGGRAEFFSMITVMLGMGLVMRYVTPAVAGHPPPDPTEAAFWGFGALGLLVGAVFTYPMNALLVKIGWKHGMA
ncbi:DUF4396 domain-containing protein [Halobacterium zhouii]|uniref:DUF4396 domain-containing protein n=1 Tax=Halobacterium zhouii TaxID=2902624 RepID=UPI001E4FCC4F|nr:DUF4396 domain-containing protein [Halobacterium zhouii]